MRNYFRFVVYLFAFIGFSQSIADTRVDFFRAVGIDNARTVSALLDGGFDPNTLDDKGQVGLFLALREGSLKVAEALLRDPRLKIDATNAAGETPLMMAALRGNLEWTRRLLDRGAQFDREGWTPLHYAASGPEPKVVALLLDRGARIDARSPNGTTPLMMAARYGAEEGAELLLARGASVAARNDLDLGVVDFARQGGRDNLAARLERLTR
jgi:ankyrin repeat protein